MLKINGIAFGLGLAVMSLAVSPNPLPNGPPDAASDSLTLERALKMVARNHPGLEAGRSAVLAREAALMQGSRGPNPELGIEVEDIAGTGELRGMKSAQSTLQISQTLEGGDKRGKRKQVALVEKALAEKELGRKGLELQALTHAHFMDALAAQKRLAMAHESQSLAKRLLDAVVRRVREGAASTADEIRANLAVTEAELEARQDTLRLETAKKKLALLWGEDKKPFFALQDELESLRTLPSAEELTKALEQGLQVALQAEHVRLAEARLLEQQTLSSPDMTLSAGIRHSAAPGDLSWVGGISVPLPIRNRNLGGKDAARHRVAEAKAEEKAALLELKSGLAEIHRAISLAWEEITTLRERLIPDSERAAHVLEEGYRRGRFGVLDVLNSEADLFRQRVRYLDALVRYQQGYADLERLIGTNDVSGKASKQGPQGKED